MELTAEQLRGASRQTRRGLKAGRNGGAVALPKRRIQLAIAQSWRCHWCQHPCREDMGYMNSATVEHVIPQSRGGPNEPWNLMMACHRCNTLRQDHCWESFEVRAKALLPDARTVEEATIVNRRLALRRRNQRIRERARAAQSQSQSQVAPFQSWLFSIYWWTRLIPV